MSLKKQTFKGIKWTSVSTISTTVLQILQIAVLARFLTAEDFGLMALVQVLLGLSLIVVDAGISNAIIHKKEISHVQLSSLYWLTVGCGILLFGAMFATAPWIAVYYNQPMLGELIRIMSFSFLVLPLGQQYRFLLQKQFCFNVIAKVEVVASLASFVLAVVLAYLNFGVYSLVYSAFLRVVLVSLLFFVRGLRIHRPSFILRFGDIKEFIRFGLFQVGENFINYFNTQLDIIIIGKLLGANVLGVYSLAKTLVMRPAQVINPIITRVTFPVMASVQSRIRALKVIYLKTIKYVSLINFPVYVLMAVFAKETVLILFGPAWLEAVPILRILSVFGLVRATGNPVGSLLLAKGRADLGFYWNLALFFIIPITVYLASGYGIIGVCIGLLSLQILLTFPNYFFLVRKIAKAGMVEYFLNIFIPLAITLFAAVAASTAFFASSDWVTLVVGAAIFVITYVIINHMTRYFTIDSLREFLR